MPALPHASRQSWRSIRTELQPVEPIYRLGASNENASPRDGERFPSTGVCWAGLLIGLMPVTTAVANGSAWGAEPTLGLMIAVPCAVGLARAYVRSRRRASLEST